MFLKIGYTTQQQLTVVRAERPQNVTTSDVSRNFDGLATAETVNSGDKRGDQNGSKQGE